MERKDKQKAEKFSVRTDLAIEAREMVREGREEAGEPDGVQVETKHTEDYELTRVHILTEQGSQTMGKPVGSYITLEAQKLKENDPESHSSIVAVLSKELQHLAKPKKRGTVLVVGLGNWNITPDALGPKVVSRVLVTRHLRDTLPEDMAQTVRPVAAVSPGVMGITGIETGEIVKGIVEKMHPDLVIAIDALAARKTSRINAAISFLTQVLLLGQVLATNEKCSARKH